MRRSTYFHIMFLMLFLSTLRIIAQTEPKREFRGVWVATVSNIDWPSSRDLTSAEQKREFIEMLEMFKSMNFNAVIFQIRPSADAFYESKFEPWSMYLNGMSGEAPAPYYDPLAFFIEETHKRGMEFHAWLNPYRAVVNYQEYQPNPLPLTYEQPEWFINYGKNKYFDPGIPEVREYTLNIVTDIVQNYDVDAIHFDDYFYPYKINGESFKDDLSFKAHGASFYPGDRDAWRRNNVNLIISQLYNRIKAIKPWVQFGVSPFGVWRNGDKDPRGSDTRAGQTNYDDLHADIALWIQRGWVDYLIPQAYWHIGHEKAGYEEVVKWWSENTFGTRLYIGHGAYKLSDPKADKAWMSQNPTEIEKQIRFNRSISKIQGSAFFSASSFKKNPYNLRERMTRNAYTDVALTPVVNDNLKMVPQPVKNVRLEQNRNREYNLVWESPPENREKQAVKYLIYQFDSEDSIDLNHPKAKVLLTGLNHLNLTKKEAKTIKTIVIRAVSRNNDVSDPVSFKF